MYLKGTLLPLLVLMFLFTPPAFAEPELSAKAAVLLDGKTGRVLFEKNAFACLPMASTTKIMTAIVALERGNPDDIVMVSRKAAAVEGSSIWLRAGEKLRLEDLIYGLMLSSGNDAAIAIAEHIGGSAEGFVEMMNEKARRIGALDTNFKNPSGLDEEGHYTTAYDLALITRYALSNSTFAEIVKTKRKTIPWEGHEWDRALINHNKLLSQYEGCDGVKTGYTKKTGRCLVSSATRGGWQIIAVTLSAPDDWNDHRKLLDYGFENYRPYECTIEEDLSAQVSYGTEASVSIVPESKCIIHLADGEQNKVITRYRVKTRVSAPVKEGQKLGEMIIELDSEQIAKIDLIAAHSVGLDKKARFFGRLGQALRKILAVFK